MNIAGETSTNVLRIVFVFSFFAALFQAHFFLVAIVLAWFPREGRNMGMEILIETVREISCKLFFVSDLTLDAKNSFTFFSSILFPLLFCPWVLIVASGNPANATDLAADISDTISCQSSDQMSSLAG